MIDASLVAASTGRDLVRSAGCARRAEDSETDGHGLTSRFIDHASGLRFYVLFLGGELLLALFAPWHKLISVVFARASHELVLHVRLSAPWPVANLDAHTSPSLAGARGAVSGTRWCARLSH